MTEQLQAASLPYEQDGHFERHLHLVDDDEAGILLGDFNREEVEKFYGQINQQAEGDYLLNPAEARTDEISNEVTALLALYATGRTRLEGLAPTLDQIVTSLEQDVTAASKHHDVRYQAIYQKRQQAAILIGKELDRIVGGIEPQQPKRPLRKRTTQTPKPAKQPTVSTTKPTASRYVGSDHFKMYLQEAGSFDLLTAQQEVELAKTIEAGQYAEKLLAGDITSDIDASDEELKWLAEEGEKARNTFLERNVRLAVSLAKKRTWAITPGMQFEDLVSEANFGLIRAVEKFDFTKGYKFSTYATWWVKQSLDRAIANRARVVRIPVHRVELINKVRKFREGFERDNGFPASDDDVVSEFKDIKSTQDLKQLDDDARSVASLDRPIGDDGGETVGTMFDQAVEGTETIALGLIGHSQIHDAIESLKPDNIRELIIERFGFNGQEPKTLEEIAQREGVTREAIRMRQAKGLRQLHDFLQDTHGNGNRTPALKLAQPGKREKDKMNLRQQLERHGSLLSEEMRDVVEAYTQSKSIWDASRLIHGIDEKGFARRLKKAREILDEAPHSASA